jgi:hypothetical protein
MTNLRLLIMVLLTVAVQCSGQTMEYQSVFSAKDIIPSRLGKRAIANGKALRGTLNAGEKTAVWRVEETSSPSKDRWASIGFQFEAQASQTPAGFYCELNPTSAVVISVEARHNQSREKGFWCSKWLGRKKISLQPGLQRLEILWSELNVSPGDQALINAVCLAVNNPTEIGFISFGVIYPNKNNSLNVFIPYMNPDEERDNPVARPFDKLDGLYSLSSDKRFTGTLSRVLSEEGSAVRWRVTGPTNLKSWAVFGIGLDSLRPGLRGLRIEVNFPQDIELELQVGSNYTLNKGFYETSFYPKKVKKLYKAGPTSLQIEWEAFDVPEKKWEDINAIRFITATAGEKIDIRKIDLVFPNGIAAEIYRAGKQKKLEQSQGVMLDALAARGIDWRQASAEKKNDFVERNIWIGVQLSAQKEQLNYFRQLTPDDATLMKLQQENATLIKKGAEGDFDLLKEQTNDLQQKIDNIIARKLNEIPASERRITYDSKAKIFRYPFGKEFRMFAPHFFRSIYPDKLRSWRPWDVRYLAGMGFNGIRLHIVWKTLEPEKGHFNQAYLQLIKDIIKETECYGMGVSVDLHWPYPEWFLKGKPGFELSNNALSPSNSYHWPEAVVDTWKKLGAKLAAFPNIIAYEIPTNETPIASTPKGLTGSKYLMMQWNKFLQEQYGTRETLQACWGSAARNKERYRLAENENWNENTINPLGFQNDPTPDEAYTSNPRFYDHLKFCAMLQKTLTGSIIKALRQSNPQAIGMFQRTIGGLWDHSPVPVQYMSIITCNGENVIPGTHYNMGSVEARKAATISRGSYDSEQQMEGNKKAVEKHVKLGLGFCPFAFHSRGGGGMLLADDAWHLKKDVAYLPKMATWIRNSSPASFNGIPVAIIINSRQQAVGNTDVETMIDSLERLDCRVGVFESLRIMDEPDQLTDYCLAITSTDYADVDLINLLNTKFKGIVLLTGSLDIDAYARRQEDGLPGFLIKHQLLLKSLPVKRADKLAGQIDLSGTWDFFFSGKIITAPSAPQKKPQNTEKMKVPSMWGEVGLTGSLNYRIGDGWYYHSFIIPKEWQSRKITLEIGAVDDLDWVFFNGCLIGNTDEKTSNYWLAPRSYIIPEKLIRFNEENELCIMVRNLRNDGGIWKDPIKLNSGINCKVFNTTGEIIGTAVCSEQSSLIPKEQLMKNVEIIAEFELPGEKRSYAGFIRQNHIFWYFANQELDDTRKVDAMVLKTVLDRAKLL